MKIIERNGSFVIVHKGKTVVRDMDLKDLTYIGTQNGNSLSYKKFKSILPIIDAEYDLDVLSKEIKDSILGLIPAAPEEVEPIKLELDKTVTEYQQLGELVTRQLGADFEKVFKQMLSCIASMWYAETESVYIILLAFPGSGKSTLCECFNYCEDAHTVDNLSPHALEPGTASADQEVNSVLDEAANKTLIVHDLTAIFSDSVEKSKRFKGVFENIFGKKGYTKASPGVGSRTYGERLNLIFGVTPYVFWSKYAGSSKKIIGLDWINSERFLYIKIPERMQYDDYIEGRIVRDLEEIKKKTAGFLFNLKEAFYNPEINKETRKCIAGAVREHYDLSKEKKNTATRRMKQCEMYCKALMLIEGKKLIDQAHIDNYSSLLQLVDPNYKKNISK